MGQELHEGKRSKAGILACSKALCPEHGMLPRKAVARGWAFRVGGGGGSAAGLVMDSFRQVEGGMVS